MAHKILTGDCLAVLATLPDNSIDCCITSPPYWQLRDYNITGQLGREPTLREYIDNLTAVFAEVRRVLQPWGTLYLNLGDSHASGGKVGEWRTTPRRHVGLMGSHKGQMISNRNGCPVPDGLKPKDLILVPHRVAIALQESGWYVRMDNVWSKPNCVPESVKDRPTLSHEYVFLLSKSRRYFYDLEVEREPLASTSVERSKYTRINKPNPRRHKQDAGYAFERHGRDEPQINPRGRQLRSVWHITASGGNGAHFAVMSPRLAERCIKLGTSEYGYCTKCQAPWLRQPDMSFLPACSCNAEVRPAIVLDPFCGSGTTGAQSVILGRDFIGVELNPEYVTLAEEKIANEVAKAELDKKRKIKSKAKTKAQSNFIKRHDKLITAEELALVYADDSTF